MVQCTEATVARKATAEVEKVEKAEVDKVDGTHKAVVEGVCDSLLY